MQRPSHHNTKHGCGCIADWTDIGYSVNIASVSHIGERCCVTILVCYTAVVSVVTQHSSHHNTKHDCGCMTDWIDIGYSVNTALVSHIGEGYGVMILVRYTAVFSVVMQRSSRHNTKHDCGCMADWIDIGYSVNIALVSHIGEGCCVTILVCYTAVLSVVMQRSSRHNTKHDCGCMADWIDIGYSVNIALVSHIGEGCCVTILVCYTAVLSVVMQRSSRHNTKHGCGCVAD